MRLQAVVTSIFNLADGEELTRIWNATVTSEPPDLALFPFAFELVDAPSPSCSACPSGKIVNPFGSKGMHEVSSPLIAVLIDGRSTGQ